MDFTTDYSGHEAEIMELYEVSFGTGEGPIIAGLVNKLFHDQVQVFSAWEGSALLGAICFTPMVYNDPRKVTLLSPVAVHPDHQGRGVGQKLIRHGLAAMPADVALTYGDPNYYGKFGFLQITEQTVPAPQPLSMPFGWLGQSLTQKVLEPLKGPARCVAAFDDPAMW